MNRFQKFKEDALRKPGIKESFDDGIDNLRLGIEIARLREQSGLSQTKLAALIDSSQAVVSRVENGGNVKIHTLNKILRVLGAELNITKRKEPIS